MNSIMRNFQKRNMFNLTHDRKFSCDMGQLIPIMCEEILPGDTFKVSADLLVRLSPLVSPTMHEINALTYFFFVPNRLIWVDWEKFITGGVNGTDATVAPYITCNNTAESSLLDYFGLPLNVAINHLVSALPMRAYAKIFNDWFRNQTLQAELTMSTASGLDSTTSLVVVNKNWEKDYFTSALPWTQRGNPVTVSLGGVADVTIPANGQTAVGDYGGGSFQVWEGQTGGTGVVVQTNALAGEHGVLQGQDIANKDLEGTADMSTATAIKINDLRLAFQLQKWLEKNARAGARYYESIMAHFGVQTSDYRLQRSEFLGGGKSPMIISEVLQTSKTESGAPQGNMAGHGFSAQRSHAFTKSFEEHGYVIGLFCVMPRTSYQQGLSRCLTRTSRYDYYWPLFANLGEQAVLNQEIWFSTANGISIGQNGYPFGYQGRYDEYRRRENSVHGAFRSTLNTWHMSRIFTALPGLDTTFVTADPSKRIHAVPIGETLWVYLKNNVRAIRPLPKIGEPGLIDH